MTFGFMCSVVGGSSNTLGMCGNIMIINKRNSEAYRYDERDIIRGIDSSRQV
jgi:hypothetical protein